MWDVISYHGVLRSFLAQVQHCTVLSVHRRAANLRLVDGTILSLVHPDLGNGPATLVLRGPWPLPLEAGARVAVALAGGGAPWEPAPPPGQERLTRSALAAAEAAVAEAGSHEGLLPQALGGWQGTGFRALMALRGIRALKLGLWEAAIRSLAGLGPGLTPSGDDLLCGYAAALHRLASPLAAPCAQALGELPESASPPLSRHFMRWAARGVAGEHHLGWLDSVLRGSPIPPDRLLAHGATSGADWAAGALLALRDHLQAKEHEHEAV